MSWSTGLIIHRVRKPVSCNSPTKLVSLSCWSKRDHIHLRGSVGHLANEETRFLEVWDEGDL